MQWQLLVEIRMRCEYPESSINSVKFAFHVCRVGWCLAKFGLDFSKSRVVLGLPMREVCVSALIRVFQDAK